MIDVLFAGIAVADFEAARAWYARLLGRAADIIAKDDEVMWQIRDGGWLYVVGDSSRTGHALVTLAVGDLDSALVEIEARGISPSSIETIAGAGRKASIVDPEGNTINLIEVDQPSG